MDNKLSCNKYLRDLKFSYLYKNNQYVKNYFKEAQELEETN